jgi:hypothetical protein
MASPTVERRQRPRATGVQEQLECLVPSARIRDISLSGVYLLLAEPPATGQDVQIRIWLRSGESIDAHGVVRRVEPGRGAAVEFTEMDTAGRNLLAQYLSLHFSSGGESAP